MSWLQSIPFLSHLKRRDRDRLARYNIVIAILLAGWFPSMLMLIVSYTILNRTLETKILHDRQTFVQLIAQLDNAADAPESGKLSITFLGAPA